MLSALFRYYISLHYWQSASPASTKQMQLKKFRALFEHARRNSKFYREYYGDKGVLDLKIEAWDDIAKVPVVSKALLRRYATSDIMTFAADDSVKIHSTSGSTGEPFRIACSGFEDYTSHVRVTKALMKKGYTPFKKMVLLSRYEAGHEFAIETNLKKIGWLQKKTGLFQRELISIFEPLPSIIRKLEKSRPFILWSTPSVIELVAWELKKNGRRLNIPLVLFMSENISPAFIELFRERVGNDFIDLYGCMESPSIAFGTDQSDAKSVFSNSTLVEVVNRRRMGEDTIGDVLISNLINHTMPLIRYDLGDYAEVLDQDSFPSMRLGKIFGRFDDIVHFGGKYTLTYHQTYQLFRDFHECERYKFIQKPGGEIVLQLKVTDTADKGSVMQKARQRWQEKYPDYPLVIEWRDDFPIDRKTGKFKVIEKLDG